ncbi:MAG: amidohydrolase [Clostridia bacterium]|nr:amidohydrolase [Clostridia bacterium]
MKSIDSAVENYRQLILDAERYIWKHPETGYREFKTSQYMAEKFEEMGYSLTMAGDIPGFYTVVDTGRPGPEVVVFAELDSLICPNHPECDKETGYVHACGHNAQCAALLGVAGALTEKEVLDKLCGRIKLCAVPAEELIEIGYRMELKKRGVIKYLGGKAEFLSRGYLDGADIVFMVHTASDFGTSLGSVGCIAKKVTYKGVSAHAGGAPWDGINAVYAATQGLSAANALRETFKEENIIRFHPIITHGGEAVNAIPEKVVAESFVRGKTFDAMVEANKNINRALISGALAVGGNVDIEDTPGYAPLVNNRDLIELTKEAADLIIPEEKFEIYDKFSSGSTDMGEMTCLFPSIHPYAGGRTGKSHGDDYYITDPERACVKSAKMQVMMLELLLKDGAKRAKKIIKEFKPMFKSKEEYFEYIEKITSSGDRITYGEDGVTIRA